ncbi:hypothetical protein EVAR_82142_1 [Eumeta japonica]|uniref:Uncharacterized protein n=1 Tax=Eumeta variegata TaxID=151549 RepID=A0A4C1U1Z6_EUMVA|nr:hypothetical protein EVAR_82142_1 [Eumeta japonica]
MQYHALELDSDHGPYRCPRCTRAKSRAPSVVGRTVFGRARLNYSTSVPPTDPINNVSAHLPHWAPPAPAPRFILVPNLVPGPGLFNFDTATVLVEKPTEEDSTIIAVGDTSAADHVNVDDVCMAHIRAENLKEPQTSTFFENVR